MRNYTPDIKVHFIFFKHMVVEFYGNLLAFCGFLFTKVVTKGKLTNIQGQEYNISVTFNPKSKTH